MFYEQTTLNCKGHLLDLSEPIVMGTLNITPDSFFEQSRVQSAENMLKKAEIMLKDGATILDIGGMSSRPGAEIISEKEELKRVIPAIETVIRYFPKAIISVDTLRANVARKGVEVGARLINDISGGDFDKAMFQTVADLKNIPYILMHMKGNDPKIMQKQAEYEDIAVEILDYFIERLGILRGLAVKDIIIDVGFGFGKTIEHNFTLLKKMHIFKMLEVPILVGLSRKTMIWKTLDITPEEALNGTTALNMIALQQGAKILRVHDVNEAVQTIKLFQKVR
jgi:dihydropteroate synthase